VIPGEHEKKPSMAESLFLSNGPSVTGPSGRKRKRDMRNLGIDSSNQFIDWALEAVIIESV
jgi:hypothetical protein